MKCTYFITTFRSLILYFSYCTVCVTIELLVVGCCYGLCHYSKLDLGTNAPLAEMIESVVTCEAGLYMVNMNARTFL